MFSLNYYSSLQFSNGNFVHYIDLYLKDFDVFYYSTKKAVKQYSCESQQF